MKYIYLIAVLAFVTKAEFDPYKIGSTASSTSSAYSPEASPSPSPSSNDYPAQGASKQQFCRIRTSDAPAKDPSTKSLNDPFKDLGEESKKTSAGDIPATDKYTPESETPSTGKYTSGGDTPVIDKYTPEGETPSTGEYTSGGDTPATDKYTETTGSTKPGAPKSTDPLGDVPSSGDPGDYTPDQPAQKPNSQFCRIRKDSPGTPIGNESQYKPEDSTETKKENVYEEEMGLLAEDSYPTSGKDKPAEIPKEEGESGSYKSKGGPHSYVKQPKQFDPYAKQ